ncbi:hypothetical protein OY671_002505 [Metschnikowia pulcherrima]|nr:hypothetical protein OY671_002505 [Metschnikowia pulcherrima]
MEPGIMTGDLSVARPVPAADSAVGDVVSSPSESTGDSVTHRVEAVEQTGDDRYTVSMKGDNNAYADASDYTASGDVWKPAVQLAGWGTAIVRSTTPAVAVPLLVGSLGSLGLTSLVPPAPRRVPTARRRTSSSLSAVSTLVTASWWGVAHAAVEPTTAAWTDQARAAAPVTAGRWQTTTAGTCVARGEGRTVLSGCTVRSISFETWGEPGSQVRNYYVAFTVPAGTRSVSFDVDLRAATGQETSWRWSGARVVAGGQFTPQQGWTCADSPRVRGEGADWQNPIYFQVAEQGGGGASACP